ncbi:MULTISPECIES: AAA family ATPase [unclassified Pseudomonas]|uniref:AAA family ATPase n=1 Tax=unclassified Pseudomonas TaxID=196821 RepID=UPI0024490768|nr:MULTISPECIES: AAA family ATPase [unclassified Pseudomonas]MDG9930812.1 AAA family ATPase [Pseudomonas sp. GD04042]MDH0485201.1 AAA family ATPase [Pseudomonas sp. GD04015]MDH0605571.1 AAA family ATPase [Pseudomonas sp. GD03869]
MITELNINGVASYKSKSILSPTKKTSLIYGLNGAGKSTISEFLYNQSEPRFAKCSVKLSQPCDFLVYNQSFLNDYFYEEDNLKGIFTLSKENKVALQQIEAETKELDKHRAAQQENSAASSANSAKLDQEKSKASTKIWEIKTKYAGGDRVLEFCLDGLKKTDLLFQYVLGLPLPEAAPDYTADDLKTEASSIEGEGAVTYNKIPNISAGWLSIEGNSLWSKIIVGSQEGSVAEFIAKAGNFDWVKEGLQFVSNEKDQQECPFCQQETITKSFIDSISSVFDEAYKDDVNSLESMKSTYETLTSSLSLQDISNSALASKELAEAWNIAFEALKASIRENVLLIGNKIKSPSAAVSLTDTKATVDVLNGLVNDLNTLIESHNDKLTNKKKTRDDIKARFWALMRWDYDQTISAYSQSATGIKDEASQISQDASKINNAIEASNLKISNLRKQTVNIEESIENINRGLVEIGIDGFSVISHGEDFYRVSRASDQGNAFHSLSEGEKTVISFLYFIELCKGQKTANAVPQTKVVVIDDPISSLSHLYVFNIGQLIKRYFINDKSYAQVFVLTHSLYFFYELTHTNKEKRAETQHLFRVIKNANGSSVISMSYEEIQNDYQSYWSVINDQASPPALIANCMRNIVEYFFNFVQKKDFNNVFQKPALSGDKFVAFYRYMNRESHSLGQNIFDIKEFDHQVFKDGLRLIFEESGYGEHYQAMNK